MKSVFQQLRLSTYAKLKVKRAQPSLCQTQLIRVQVQGKLGIQLGTREVPRGTSAIEVLKEYEGVKEALFANVRYMQGGEETAVVDTDGVVEEGMGNSEWKLVDLSQGLQGDCTLEMADFDESKSAFWHSSAHILGSAIENVFEDALLTVGPPTKDGFFYDFKSQNGRVVQESDYQQLDQQIKAIIKARHRYERLLITKEEALDLFQYNKFKTYLIESKVPDGSLTSVYKLGDFIDLCTGPHVQHTGVVKAFAITKHSASYWLGDATKDQLQRIYGVAFPEKALLEEYQRLKEEALKRDHRTVGQNQNLFFFNKLAPGSAFFLSHGTKIYNRLVDLMRGEYLRRGYQEVITPNMFHIDLWKISGHYKNYKENLFMLKTHEHSKDSDCGHQHRPELHGETFGLKPMNCPGHCLMFKNQTHSYKELPIRFADFGVLHRNEISGALSGLTRVRRFQQDDAHIFCRRDQIEQEVLACIQFLDYIYGLFGFKWDIFLSTRPEHSMGSDKQWEEAETQLKSALDRYGKQWKLNKGDGAFYGPKIDIIVYDALGRAQQCGTIQLDFQLPIRFNLQYTTANKEDNFQPVDPSQLGSEVYPPDEFSSERFEWKEQSLKQGHERPVIIHRAILGSVERFLAILIEHLGGKWPVWLSPRQVLVCAISEKYTEYARKVYKELKDHGFEVEIDESDGSINKKVRNAQLSQVNYTVIVGDQEQSTGTVEVRAREGGERIGKMTIEEFAEKLKSQYPPGVALPQRLYNSKADQQSN